MKRSLTRLGRALTIGGVALGLAGCSTTHQTRSLHTSGFLSDYAQLQPGTGDQAKLIYINETTDFGRYSRIVIDPVQLWLTEDRSSALSKLSRQDQQLLVDYLSTSLHDTLGRDFLIVDQPGPDVLRIRAAITDGRNSKPVADLVSAAIPFGMGITYSRPVTLGPITVEAEFVDGETGQRIAAAVDRRGGTNVSHGNLSNWGDVKDLFNYWARRVQARLAELRAHQD